MSSPDQDMGLLPWALGLVTTVFAGAIKWVRGDVSNRVHKDTFKQYVDGQEKLTEAHVKSVETLTDSVLRAHERIDDVRK